MRNLSAIFSHKYEKIVTKSVIHRVIHTEMLDFKGFAHKICFLNIILNQSVSQLISFLEKNFRPLLNLELCAEKGR